MTQAPLYTSEADDLEFEIHSEFKHEFVADKVYAMTGAGWNHNIIIRYN
ncbi:MAG: hypothetical protein ACFE0Q_01025 [Anaerolineae bacterium]